MGTSMWLTVFAGLILAISVPVLIVSARSMARALNRLRRSPDDRMARFESGWQGTFTVLNGLASSLCVAVLLVDLAGPSGLALAGVVIVNLLVQPVALLVCWVGVRKVALGLSGRLAYAWRLVPESELTGLRHSERRRLAWFCVFQGGMALAFGALLVVSCAGLLIQAASPVP